MQRLASGLTLPLFLAVALAGCSSSPPAASSAASGQPVPSSTAATTAATTNSGGGGGTGSITFTGKYSGKLTVLACESGIVQLVSSFDGETTTGTGIIDADDFTFVGPHKANFTLAKGAPKPQISGNTYTIASGTKLVGVTNDDTVTAGGSVTCT